jgi:hypothetical protein
VQEEGDLFERGVLGQIVDGIPCVPELPQLAVDVGDGCLGGDDVLEALLHGHVRLPWPGGFPKFTKE